MRMTPISRMEKVSRWKRNAKAKTNTSEEDLHIAVKGLVSATDEDIMC